MIDRRMFIAAIAAAISPTLPASPFRQVTATETITINCSFVPTQLEIEGDGAVALRGDMTIGNRVSEARIAFQEPIPITAILDWQERHPDEILVPASQYEMLTMLTKSPQVTATAWLEY